MDKLDKAPQFEAETFSEKLITLEDFTGKKIWLAFFRYASCPLCNLHIHEVINRHSEIIEKNIVFLAVFQSSKESVKKYVGSQNVPFEIICDPLQEIYTIYKVGSSFTGFLSLKAFINLGKAMSKGFLPGRMEGDMARLPCDILINEQGEIIHRYDGKDISDHITVNQVLKLLP